MDPSPSKTAAAKLFTVTATSSRTSGVAGRSESAEARAPDLERDHGE